jgi:hypothetical protein
VEQICVPPDMRKAPTRKGRGTDEKKARFITSDENTVPVIRRVPQGCPPQSGDPEETQNFKGARHLEETYAFYFSDTRCSTWDYAVRMPCMPSTCRAALSEP